MLANLTIPATLESLEKLTPLIDQVAEAAPGRLRGQLALAVHELCVNIVEHAYAGIEGDIRLEAEFNDHSVQFAIFDSGPNAYEETEIVTPDPFDLPEHGWGIPILHRVMDEVHYQRVESGNEWRLVKFW